MRNFPQIAGPFLQPPNNQGYLRFWCRPRLFQAETISTSNTRHKQRFSFLRALQQKIVYTILLPKATRMQHVRKERLLRAFIQKTHCARKKETLGTNCWYIGLENNVERIDSIVSSWLMQFISIFSCSCVPSIPNTSINFSLVDASKPILCSSPSLFITKAWSSLLKHYPSALRLQMLMLFWQSALLRYKKLEAYILSSNLPSALLNPRKIDDKLSDDLVVGRISQILSTPLFVCFLLGLVPQKDGRFRSIHHFSSHQASLSTIVSQKKPYTSITSY